MISYNFIAGFMVGVVITVVCVLWFMEGFIKVVRDILREPKEKEEVGK